YNEHNHCDVWGVLLVQAEQDTGDTPRKGCQEGFLDTMSRLGRCCDAFAPSTRRLKKRLSG
ncbi:MAG: hypothetical protein ACYSUI_25840, partial [Planctomycetota bacterium]